MKRDLDREKKKKERENFGWKKGGEAVVRASLKTQILELEERREKL